MIKKIFIGLLIVIFLGIALLPTLISTGLGHRALTNIINTAIPGKVEIEKIQVSWFRGVEVFDFRLSDPEGNMVFSVEQLSSKGSLFTALRGFKKGVDVIELEAHLTSTPEGVTNVQQALGPIVKATAFPLDFPIILNHVNGEVSFDTVSLKGETQHGDTTGNFSINLSPGWRELLEGKKAEKALINVAITRFPVAILDALGSLRSGETTGPLQETLGPELNITLQSAFEEGQNKLALAINTANISAELKGDFSDQLLNINGKIITDIKGRKTEIEIDSVPDAYGLNLTLNSGKLSIPQAYVLFPSIDLDHLELRGNLSIPELRYGNHAWRDIQATWAVNGPQDRITFDFTSDLLKGHASVRQWYRAGQISLKGGKWDIQAHAEQFPTALASRLAMLDPDLRKRLVVLIGKTSDADVNVSLDRLNGPVQAMLKGQNGYVHLDATIKNHILTLNRPFRAEVKATPELGKAVLSDVVPILGDVIGAQNPITLTIAPQGFALPLGDIRAQDIQLQQATIEMGKMNFTNKGQLASILSVLKIKPAAQILVWFTPMYVSMHQGTIYINRTDMLVMNSYPIALWGNVNIPTERVDMAIGITARTLQQTMGIASLKKNYMLHIPLKGTLHQAKINTAKATAQITSLMAQSATGPAGQVIGAFLDVATGAMKQPKTPPPTTNPLPWETGPAKNEPTEIKELGDTKKKKKHGIDQIEKGAEGLLKKFLR